MLKKTLICILLVGSVHFAMAESLNDALNRSRSDNSVATIAQAICFPDDRLCS